MIRSSINILYFIIIACIFFSCVKEYSLESHEAAVSAGALTDSLGNCLQDSVYGTFYNGISPSHDTNYVQLKVNVTSAGVYSIHTDLQNGFEFSDSGFFSNTGINTIKLKTSGIAVLPIPTVFTVQFGSTSCNFTINIKDSTGLNTGGNGGGIDTAVNTSADSAWQFNAGNIFFHGKIIGAHIFDTSGFTILAVIGEKGDSTFNLALVLPDSTVVPGNYPSTSKCYFGYYNGLGRPVYLANPTTNSVITNVILTSYDAVTGDVEGTFSGTALDASGAAVIISNGKFEAEVR